MKLREYHAGLKAALIDKGYDISPDFDEERYMIGHTKADYARVLDQERQNSADAAESAAERQRLRVEKGHVETTARRLNAHLKVIDEERQAAIDDAIAEGRREVADEMEAAFRARRDADAAAAAVRALEDRLRTLIEQVEQDLEQAGPMPPMPTFEDISKHLLDSQPDLAMRFLKSQRFKDGTTMFDRFQTYARAEYAKQQQPGEDHILDRNSSTRFQTWLNRTVSARRKMDRAGLGALSSQIERSGRDSRGQRDS